MQWGMQWGKALGVLQEMVHRQIRPDIFSCNAVMSACEAGAQQEWENALGAVLVLLTGHSWQKSVKIGRR